MKKELLVADVTPVRSPARAEHEIMGMILDVSWPIQATYVVEQPLYDVAIPS